jgi:hypothetical protein
LLASCAELPDHIDRRHTAAAHTLVAASVQGRASCASVTTASTLRALCSIGCLACRASPSLAELQEPRSDLAQGARVCSKGPTRSAGVRRPLPPCKGSRRMTSSPQPCPTCAAPHAICCVAENMQHQTHSRSPLTHEDMLERDRSEVGFVSSFSPAASPSRARPRGARSLVPFSSS